MRTCLVWIGHNGVVTKPTLILDRMQFFGRLAVDYQAMFGVTLESLKGKAQTKQRELKAMEQAFKEKPKPITFVMQKNTVKDLRKIKKNWERKIEIAELEAR